MEKERNIEYLELEMSSISRYEKNAKRHSLGQIEMIMDSIREFGYINPIVVDEKNEILAGHARYEALRRLGYEKVKVIRVHGLSEAEKRAYRLIDNKLTEKGKWDVDVLREEVERLVEDMEIAEILRNTGFDDTELNKILGEKKEKEGEVEFSEELYERYDFIVLFFENEIDWLWANELFGLKRVRGKYGIGKKQIGVGRVLKGREALERLIEKVRKGAV